MSRVPPLLTAAPQLSPHNRSPINLITHPIACGPSSKSPTSSLSKCIHYSKISCLSLFVTNYMYAETRRGYLKLYLNFN